MIVTVPLFAARRAKLRPAIPLPITRNCDDLSIGLLQAPPCLTWGRRFPTILNYVLFPPAFHHFPHPLARVGQGRHLPLRRLGRGRPLLEHPAGREVRAVPAGGSEGPAGPPV